MNRLPAGSRFPIHHVHRSAQAQRKVIPRMRLAVIILAALLLVASAALVLVLVFRPGGTAYSGPASINSKEYQAVFLSNGQVYFGKLSVPSGNYYYLRHVYYLQSQAVTRGPGGRRQRLIKLGSEIHGPEDLMIINRDQVLYLENLKPSGQVSRAIARSSVP